MNGDCVPTETLRSLWRGGSLSFDAGRADRKISTKRGAAIKPGIDASCYRLAMKRSEASIKNTPKAISS